MRLLLVASVALISGCSAHPPEPCTLPATAVGAFVVGRDAPISSVLKWNSDMLAIRNLDSAEWQNTRVAILGFEVTTNRGKVPTGRYLSTAAKSVKAGEWLGYELKNFENAKGGKWISITMHAVDMELRVTRDGAECRADVTISGDPPPLPR
jgi:hypothetical protein